MFRLITHIITCNNFHRHAAPMAVPGIQALTTQILETEHESMAYAESARDSITEALQRGIGAANGGDQCVSVTVHVRHVILPPASIKFTQ